MDPYDVNFKASDARGLVKTLRTSREQVFHKIHAKVVRKIKQAADKNRLYTSYKVPLVMLEYSNYSPQTALEWLIERLERDGFKLQVDFRTRYMVISWAVYDTEDGLGKTKPNKPGKSVRFKLPKENIYKFN